MTDYEDLMKRCQRGATNLNDANNLLADCYGTLDAMAAEIIRIKAENESLRNGANFRAIQSLRQDCAALRTALAECTVSLEAEVLQKFHGQKPEDMHPVTRREYDRDMAEINAYKAISAIGTEASQEISNRGRAAIVDAMSKEV